MILLGSAQAAQAHGGVVAEDDLCIINIGYLKAHFKIYVPQVTGHREYCEDIPVLGESVFVMEYLHDGLGTAPVAFRIIRNTTGKGTFARLEDVRQIRDLEAVTERYVAPAVVPGAYAVLHEFAEEGDYIGIVTATGAGAGKEYVAVFPFAVGSRSAGAWPWVIAAILLLQFQYWYWRRRTQGQTAADPAAEPSARGRSSGRISVTALAALACIAQSVQGFAAEGTVVSRGGHFNVSYAAELDPLQVNRMHAWNLVIRDPSGAPVAGAEIRVEGGMPTHDHGLPTAPQARPGAAAGQYRIDGLRFHMPGEWFLSLAIDDGATIDRVVIRFAVK